MRTLNQTDLSEAVVALQNGQTVVFPTETTYGLGCDAANQEAVDNIFKIKERKSDKPLLVLVPTIEMAKKYLVWNDLLEDLSKKYWPGSLTIVGEYKKFSILSLKFSKLAKGVISKDNTIAVRVTTNPVAKLLTVALERPLVATSANLADAGEIYDPKQIETVFSSKEIKPDILIDGGELPHNPPTTIVSVVKNNLKILRQGQTKIN